MLKSIGIRGTIKYGITITTRGKLKYNYELETLSAFTQVRLASNHSPMDKSEKLTKDSDLRINPVGIQRLSKEMHEKVFGDKNVEYSEKDPLVKLAKEHLSMHNLWGKKTIIGDPINFSLPKVQGKTLDEHFHNIALKDSEPYFTLAKELSKSKIPPIPSQWIKKSGWVKYVEGQKPVSVDYPNDSQLVFDVEVLYKISDYAVMATAVSPQAWYAWVSPWVMKESDSPNHLIPLGNNKEKVIVGHNVSYDRKRVLEEYSILQTRNMFLDTLSFHVATSGMCSRQRGTWGKYKKAVSQLESEDDRENLEIINEEIESSKEENPWVSMSSYNGLADVAKLHCNITLDKSVRNYFGELDNHGVYDMLDELLQYCAKDVQATFKVYSKVFPRFLEVCPHPVTFTALRHISSVFLPIDESWTNYINTTESLYQKGIESSHNMLQKIAFKTLELADKPDIWKNDPWLSQLNWKKKPVRYTKPKKKDELPRLAKNQKFPGYPMWFVDLHPTAKSAMHLTMKSRITPLLLKLQWEDKPFVWSETYGWMFGVPVEQKEEFLALGYTCCDMNLDQNIEFRDNAARIAYLKIPHKDGADARCTLPLSKNYLSYFEKGKMTSVYSTVKAALKTVVEGSYWASSRERIKSQMTVWNKEFPMGVDDKHIGMILPAIIPMGTVTRRAVENTWLTASNAKKNRLGSELKAMVKAPPGYKFVGADVDSEELWIASLFGDSLFKIHGGTALGWMTLEGSKSEGTDLHSSTANIIGISRNEAKIFNYGRIYGAGVKFAGQLLKQFNPQMTKEMSTKLVNKLYESTKGKKRKGLNGNNRPLWTGGTESIVFNRLEDIADQDFPRTPVLGAAVTDALKRGNLVKASFMTSRVNWVVQSSGVDYLHLLIVAMQHLIQIYKIDARLCITVHDEIRYMVKEKDQYRAALALQISNLWTRAMFSQQVGINDLPQSCAFFSAIDIDTVLRKEVDMDCVTPSHPNSIAPGESLDITALLAKNVSLSEDHDRGSDPVGRTDDLSKASSTYVPKKSVFQNIDATNKDPEYYLAAQIVKNMRKIPKIIGGERYKDARLRNSEVDFTEIEPCESKMEANSINTNSRYLTPKSGKIKARLAQVKKGYLENSNNRADYNQLSKFSSFPDAVYLADPLIANSHFLETAAPDEIDLLFADNLYLDNMVTALRKNTKESYLSSPSRYPLGSYSRQYEDMQVKRGRERDL
ncbi:hypothetical protein NADFUDRAFT_60318 [Nadsonia fulvescens var. elongata DSM 6958]|uniref:DNA polymerase gamma n=1 Tax=Nadsonia fulvescens var. elongata DSM 6958 TaxID=857566 RepID=A0A1E3PH76_9ASCO|nr:hypothetical protein NADFUDRAFT_60318 [Nadsonia fulvescens var. elongata DSM 6958]